MSSNLLIAATMSKQLSACTFVFTGSSPTGVNHVNYTPNFPESVSKAMNREERKKFVITMKHSASTGACKLTGQMNEYI